MDMRGEAGLRFGVTFHIVAHVDEISFARLQSAGKSTGFLYGFVAVRRGLDFAMKSVFFAII